MVAGIERGMRSSLSSRAQDEDSSKKSVLCLLRRFRVLVRRMDTRMRRVIHAGREVHPGLFCPRTRCGSASWNADDVQPAHGSEDSGNRSRIFHFIFYLIDFIKSYSVWIILGFV
ncbi:hypothetical protein D3C87_659960 [compost metagenome]